MALALSLSLLLIPIRRVMLRANVIASGMLQLARPSLCSSEKREAIE